MFDIGYGRSPFHIILSTCGYKLSCGYTILSDNFIAIYLLKLISCHEFSNMVYPFFDTGLKILSENCTNLRKLGLRDCHLITDAGISLFAYYCRNLINLNVVNCSAISRESYLYVKRCNKKCKIEHSNPNFY